jgi:hypothetical protein
MSALLLTLSDGKLYLALLGIVLVSAIVEIVCQERRFALALRGPMFFVNLALTVMLIGLRWGVGTDWESYKELFDNLEFNSDFLLNVYHFDPGYVALNAVLKFIFNSYTFFLLTCATLALGMVANAILRLSPVHNLSLFVFISSYLPIHFFGSTRRGIAIAAASLFLVTFRKDRLGRRWKWLATAFLFHRTAVILLISLPLRRMKFDARISSLILAVAMIIGVGGLFIELIQIVSAHLLGFSDVQIVDQLIYYGETFNEHTPDGVNPVTAGLVSFARKMILFFFFASVVHKAPGTDAGQGGAIPNPAYEHLLKIYVFGMAIYGMFIGAPIFQIVGVYFLYLEVLLIPMCFQRLGKNTKYLFLLYVVAMNLAQYISALTVYPDVFIPYKSVLL